MLFTWDTTDLCIIFRQWHIHSTTSLLFSLLGIVLLTAGYELIRELSRQYEASSAEYLIKLPSKPCPFPFPRRAGNLEVNFGGESRHG